MRKSSEKTAILGLILVGILFAIPSILYIKTFNSIDGYNGTLYYFLHNDSLKHTILGVVVFALLLCSSFLLYFRVIKNSHKFNIKKILLAVFLVGFAFLIAFPNTSTDLFYYMGTGRVLEEYGQNPYYYTIDSILKENSSDMILRNSGPWKTETVIYGPIWIIICFIFNKICFGSVTLLMYIFKFLALILHIANCYLIYKITKKKKFVILYGLNPLVLIEFLINTHNDIYLVFFVLMAIYFLKNNKIIWLTLVMLAISIGIKHLTLILVPIFVLYYLQNKKMLKKIGFIVLYAIFFLILIYIMYLPFVDNVLEIYKIINTQQNRMKDSIYLLLAIITNKNMLLVSVVYSIMFFVVGYYYIILCLKLLLRNKNFRETMQSINLLFILLIFGVLTNIASWYLTWIFISIYWIKGKDIKTILWIQFLYELTYVYLYFWHSDSYNYSVIVMPVILFGTILRQLFLKVRENKKTNAIKIA